MAIIDISKFNDEINRYTTLKRSTLIKFLLGKIPDDKINDHLIEIDISSPKDLYKKLAICFDEEKWMVVYLLKSRGLLGPVYLMY